MPTRHRENGMIWFGCWRGVGSRSPAKCGTSQRSPSPGRPSSSRFSRSATSLSQAIVVAAAGFLTNIAAALSFLQQYEREKWLGEEIGARVPLLPKPPKHSLYTPLGWKARWFWFAVLLAFAGADVVAVAVTQS